MYEEAPMELDPYDEKALVIFGVGPLTGAGVPCSGPVSYTHLPLAVPHFCSHHSGKLGGKRLWLDRHVNSKQYFRQQNASF